MSSTTFLDSFITLFNYFIFFFAVTVMASYLILAVISWIALKSYLKVNRAIDYKSILSLPDAPQISIIAPAYNESKTIKENVNSLLSINYSNFNVIIVNDGSKDNSMDILIEAFELIPSEYQYNPIIETKKVKNIYVSKNPAYKKLIVIDKENGGKADALNTGINCSDYPYILCIDVDCIIDKDALLKLAKPILEETKKRIIAAGGVVRIANSCEIKSGKLIRVFAPDNWIARIQVLEYLRAFILGRMAWAKLDGLLIISGAFGLFDREIVLKCGGYNHQTVGEDMELVVRMRRFMIENKLPYKVQYIPDPLCWTEAPDTYNILIKQRSRWTRGTFETLLIHRKMLLNYKYGVLGLISYPYWLLFEYYAPIIELIGLLITIVLISYKLLYFKIYFLLLMFVYSFAVLFSCLAIYAEESSYSRYNTFKDLRKIIFVALLEPLIFHPVTVYAAIKGNWEKIKGKKSWGDMTRKGFVKN